MLPHANGSIKKMYRKFFIDPCSTTFGPVFKLERGSVSDPDLFHFGNPDPHLNPFHETDPGKQKISKNHGNLPQKPTKIMRISYISICTIARTIKNILSCVITSVSDPAPNRIDKMQT